MNLKHLQEFHFETMARANQHAETSSVASTEASRQVYNKGKGSTLRDELSCCTLLSYLTFPIFC